LVSILLSIKPEYVERVFDGSKKYEFRKRLAHKAVSRILMYSTAPIMKVVGEVQIIDKVAASPTALWECTKRFAGISRDKYRKYFKGCKVAYAYRLGEVTRYEPPKDLNEFNFNLPPQSFIYLAADQSDKDYAEDEEDTCTSTETK
jgi:predicted transcriptional regulator